VVQYGELKMTQKRTIAKAKTPATKAPKEKKEIKSVLNPRQTTIKANKAQPLNVNPKTPTQEEVNDLEWMNWVEYAQARLRYLENKLEIANDQLKAQKATIDRLNRRVMQG